MPDSLQLYGLYLPGSSVHVILQARILVWVAISSSRESSQPRIKHTSPELAGRFFTTLATREAPPGGRVMSVQASLSLTNSRSLPKPMPIESVIPSNHLILCRPLLLLPSIFPSIQVFSNESALCIRWPKYWSFSFKISPSNEYRRVISFRMDWLDLFAVQGTLKSLFQHHSSKG